MAMNQGEIQAHYEQQWKRALHDKKGSSEPRSDILVRVREPIYENLLRSHHPGIQSVIDIGSGSGHWLHFFKQRFRPKRLVGVDFTRASVSHLQSVHTSDETTSINIVEADITSDQFECFERFDCVNIANVLFHIPEDSKFDRALGNLRSLMADGGVVITTEYLPEVTYQTNMMKVRSASEFKSRAQNAGLKVVAIQPCYFFSGHAMGVIDEGTRRWPNTMLGAMNKILDATEGSVHQLFEEFLVLNEQALLGYLETKMSVFQFPGQKLVLLRSAR